MSPGPQGTSLGVDFGTSHTIAVVRRADGSVRPLLFDGAPLMPSAVCADAEGGLLVGRDAVHSGRRHPERFEPNPKRLIDRPSTLLGEREFTIPDLIAAVLDAVADECRRVVGRPSQVTLTVPAEWGPARRQVIEDAAARSGLGQVRLVPEPVAAATYYAEALQHRMAVGASIVVYDLGAGTFDASVVRRTGDGFETVALDGRNDLGGLDIDAALIEHLGVTYGAREGWKRLVNPSTIEERRYFREFQEEVRSAKERLSRHQQSDISIPLLEVEAHLTRTELEQIAEPHLEQTIRVTRAVVRAAGLDLADSAGVFLVGGASRMPLVATMLHRALGVAPTVLDQPEVVVAEGSVLWTQAGPRTVTFPLQRPQQGFAPAMTPAVNPARQHPGTPGQAAQSPAALGAGAPGSGTPTPQAAPSPAAPPMTEPVAPQQVPPNYRPTPQYAPSPPQTQQGAAVSPPHGQQSLSPQQASPQRDAGQALPPRVHQTPPVTVSAGDAPTPPKTEAERQRAKRIGKRSVITFILVDILIIVGLVWYFGPDNDDPSDGEGPSTSDFTASWADASIGDLVEELPAAHDGAITSLAELDTDEGSMLFSAGADGAIRQWSMDTGELVSEYTIDMSVDSLWPTSTSAGFPAIVALGADYTPYLWTAESGSFDAAGTPDVDLDGGIGRVKVGSIEGEPVVTLISEPGTEAQVYFIEQQYSDGAFALPSGTAYPNYFVNELSGYTEIVAVDSDLQVVLIDGLTGDLIEVLGTPSDWTEGEGVEAMGVVYDDGTPYSMLYSDMNYIYFKNLDSYDEPYGLIDYEDRGDWYHNEIVSTELGDSLLYIDQSKDAYVYAVEGWDQVPLSNADTGQVTKLENMVLDDGSEFAITGDADGNIQFWSLG